jgi:hypothetical protein
MTEMNKFRLTAAIALCGAALASGDVAAMPLGGFATAAAQASTGIHDVRWVCGPFRCWWRPSYDSYYGAYAAGPRVFVRPGWGGYHARPWWARPRWY